jgi:hypothetical protein
VAAYRREVDATDRERYLCRLIRDGPSRTAAEHGGAPGLADEIYQRVEATDFKLSGRIGKTVKNSTTRASGTVEYQVEKYCTVFATISDAARPSKRVPFAQFPGSIYGAKAALGTSRWENDEVFIIEHKNGRDRWEIDTSSVTARWFSAKAATWDAHAQYVLAKKHRDGDGVMPDRTAAVHWAEAALKSGYGRASRFLEELRHDPGTRA